MKYTYTLVHVAKGKIKVRKIQAHSSAHALAIHDESPRKAGN